MGWQIYCNDGQMRNQMVQVMNRLSPMMRLCRRSD